MVSDIAFIVLAGAGCFFFAAGTIGLIRFPDLRSRLHALTKADNLGLGLVLAAMATRADSPATVVKLVVIWALALLASATSSHLLAAGGTEDERAAR
jgi:multicomponent Na+:H+ antiporter subunit G